MPYLFEWFTRLINILLINIIPRWFMKIRILKVPPWTLCKDSGRVINIRAATERIDRGRINKTCRTACSSPYTRAHIIPTMTIIYFRLLIVYIVWITNTSFIGCQWRVASHRCCSSVLILNCPRIKFFFVIYAMFDRHKYSSTDTINRAGVFRTHYNETYSLCITIIRA